MRGDPISDLAHDGALDLAAVDPSRSHHLPAEQDYRNAERVLGRAMTGDERYHFGRSFAAEYRRLVWAPRRDR